MQSQSWLSAIFNMTVKESLKELGAIKRKMAPDIYLISFEDSLNMCMTLLRFAEHYESPKFRNKIFTLKEFKAWYKTTHNGYFSYYYDWAGFNIPSYAFVPFWQKKFNPLTKKEKLFLDVIRNIKEPYYIIAAVKGSKVTIRHEAAHGLFYTNETYRDKVTKIISGLDTKAAYKKLKKAGYCKEVLLDEFNANAVDGNKWLLEDGKIKKDLNKLFHRYWKK